MCVGPARGMHLSNTPEYHRFGAEGEEVTMVFSRHSIFCYVASPTDEVNFCRTDALVLFGAVSSHTTHTTI